MTPLPGTEPVIAPLVWAPAVGAAVRGTVVIVPGRGEAPGVYERFGRRLSVDGYRAVAVPAPGGAEPVRELIAEVEQVAADGPSPVVLVGSDSGAVLAVAAAAESGGLIRAVVAAGYPRDDAVVAGLSWEDELDARTACPVHRGRLGETIDVAPGSLAESARPELAEVVPTFVPVLFIHGADDRIAPIGAAVASARSLPDARFFSVTGGRHDVLNDVHHRSVAAQIIQFLERLRSDDGGVAVLTEIALPAKAVVA